MDGLVRTLLLCGVLSGTQPLTIMGLLLVMGGARPRANGFAYLAGAFTVQTALLLAAAAIIGGTVRPDTDAGRSLIGVRIAIGVALVVFGLLLRRPPGKPVPEIPNALTKLRGMGPGQAFVGGILVADYQGPVIASFALATAGVELGGRLVGLGVYALLATGIPLGLMLWATRSERARDRLDRATKWVMAHRRVLASWLAIVVGLLVLGDGLLDLLTA